MPLKTIVDALDDIPESIRNEYKEQKLADKTVFVLDLEGVDSHPAVANLKSAHERVKADKLKLSGDLKTATDKLKTYPEDFDQTEWDRLRAEDEARRNDPDGKDIRKQIDAATTAVETRMKAVAEREKKVLNDQITEKDGTIGELDKELRQILVRDGLTTALTAARVKPGLIEAAVARFERDVEVVVEDGHRIARMKADLGGEEIAKYVGNWTQSDAARDFIEPAKGDDERGSTSKRNLGENPFGKAHWNKSAQARLINADRAKAEQMAKAAGFKNLQQTYSASTPVAA